MSPTNKLLKEKDKANAKSGNGLKSSNGVKSASGTKSGNLSDDEPLYDSVCSDEDYASIGDNQSLQDGNKTPSKEGGRNLSAESTIDQLEMASVAARSSGDDSLKKCLSAESQRKLIELEQTNLNLKEEVLLLQNMVKKLLQENRLLRCGTSPIDVPSSLNGSHDQTGVGYRWSIPEPHNPQWLMYPHVNRDFPSPPRELLTQKSDGGESERTKSNSGTMRRQQQQTDSIEVTPTDAVPPPIPDDATLPSSSAAGAGGGSDAPPVLPTQDEVVKKTEKITRNLQELFQSAQECKHECYSSCAERIHSSVAEMVSLFPPGLVPEAMQNALDLLSTGAQGVRDLCLQTPPETNGGGGGGGAPDFRLYTQDVIKSAYDIAKAAKQLVILFE